MNVEICHCSVNNIILQVILWLKYVFFNNVFIKDMIKKKKIGSAYTEIHFH